MTLRMAMRFLKFRTFLQRRCVRWNERAEGSGEEGATLVEMALSMTVLFAVLFGLIQACLAFYMSSVLDVAAREATRWAAVRGSNSCTVLSGFPYCNYGPTGQNGTAYSAGTTNDPVEIFARSLPFPGLSGVTASAAWFTATQAADGSTQWTTTCTTANDAFGQPCNGAGHMVKVTVTYSYPLNMWINFGNLTMNSKSAMIINE